MFIQTGSSEDNTFVFPGGNSNCGNNRNRRDLDRSTLGNRGDSALSDRSTQTDPGLWMPVSVDKKGNQQVLPIERDRVRPVVNTKSDTAQVF